MNTAAIRPVETSFLGTLSERAEHPVLKDLSHEERFLLGLLTDSDKSLEELEELFVTTHGNVSQTSLLDLLIGLEHSNYISSKEVDEKIIFVASAIGMRQWRSAIQKILTTPTLDQAPPLQLKETQSNWRPTVKQIVISGILLGFLLVILWSEILISVASEL